MHNRIESAIWSENKYNDEKIDFYQGMISMYGIFISIKNEKRPFKIVVVAYERETERGNKIIRINQQHIFNIGKHMQKPKMRSK